MRFEKVSFDQYLKAHTGYEKFTTDEVRDLFLEYSEIKLPKRATKKSAGHDFFSPIPFKLSTFPERDNQSILIPTGIRSLLDDDKVLVCAPRSGHGFKYRVQLDNTIGLIDADYADSDNEGHIFAMVTIDAKQQKELTVNAGEAFMQGAVFKYYIMEDDNVTEERNGGFGSTNK